MPLKTVLITGCGGAGIGSALAIEFHLRGHRVFATGISEAQTTHLADLGVECFALDVTSTISLRHAVSRITDATGGKLDILINNAGITQILPFADADVEAARRIMDVNFLGVFATTKAFLPLLIEGARRGQGDSIVANVGSVNQVFHPPLLGAYNASKAAVETWGASIRTELAPLGVRVVTLKTGSIRSDLFKNAPPTVLPDDSFYRPAKEYIEGRKMLEEGQFVDAKFYAKNVVDRLLRPKVSHVIWQGGLSTVAWLLSWFGWEGMMDGYLSRMHQFNKVHP
ncbi:short-chain dehydrogenase/reductase [Xylariaceae sp. FL1019]|nr:short-chain dehydrogenase/reductase [Xylariaceae sp. FL1019]